MLSEYLVLIALFKGFKWFRFLNVRIQQGVC